MSEECKIIFTLDNNDDSIKLLNRIRALAAKGYKRFTVYIMSRKGKPYYLEDLKPLLQNNILYGLKLYYVGFSKIGFKKPIEGSLREVKQ